MTNLETILKAKINRSATIRLNTQNTDDVFYIDIFRGEVRTYAGWRKLEGKVKGFDVKREIEKRYLRKVVWKFDRWVSC